MLPWRRNAAAQQPLRSQSNAREGDEDDSSEKKTKDGEKWGERNREKLLAELLLLYMQAVRVFTWFSVWEMPTRKINVAMKRLMQRCRWMVVLGLLMERISENVRMQMNRQTSERGRPTQVISCSSNLFCWEREREREWEGLPYHTQKWTEVSTVNSWL